MTDPVALLREVLSVDDHEARLDNEFGTGPLGTDLRGRIESALAEHGLTVPDLTEPSEVAAALVRTLRLRKYHKTRERALGQDAAALVDTALTHIKAGKWPTRASVAGATMFRKVDLRASPRQIELNGETFYDHAGLTEVLAKLHQSQPDENWDALFPSTVNGNSLAATFRGALDNAEFTDDQKLLPLEERLKIAGVPAELIDACTITEQVTVNANGL